MYFDSLSLFICLQRLNILTVVRFPIFIIYNFPGSCHFILGVVNDSVIMYFFCSENYFRKKFKISFIIDFKIMIITEYA